MSTQNPPNPTRKRTRKRKRRVASSSDSSSSSSSSDSDVSKALPSVTPVKHAPSPTPSSSEDDHSDSDSSTSGQESDPAIPSRSQKHPALEKSPSPIPEHLSTAIPPFLPPETDPTYVEKEKQMKDKFRKFWMESIVDGFKNDLEEIRKEPNLDASRLEMLIDSLAAGSEVYTSSKSDMDVLLPKT